MSGSMSDGSGMMRRVVQAMEQLAPVDLAGSWDNVGLIAEAPYPRAANGVFVAVDLTTDVAEELLSLPDVNTAIVYHPVIFAAVKSITTKHPIQRSILRCIASGISIYCPHTCLDVIQGGINDWIALGLTYAWESQPAWPAEQIYERVKNGAGLAPVLPNAVQHVEGEGIGRVVHLERACTWQTLIERTKRHLGVEHVQVAPAAGVSGETPVEHVAVCAGSGSSVLRSAKGAQVWVTGELGHHEVLAANAQGISVILANHTNTERKYFRDVFQRMVKDRLPESRVYVSERDRDPLQVA